MISRKHVLWSSATWISHREEFCFFHGAWISHHEAFYQFFFSVFIFFSPFYFLLVVCSVYLVLEALPLPAVYTLRCGLFYNSNLENEERAQAQFGLPFVFVFLFLSAWKGYFFHIHLHKILYRLHYINIRSIIFHFHPSSLLPPRQRLYVSYPTVLKTLKMMTDDDLNHYAA